MQQTVPCGEPRKATRRPEQVLPTSRRQSQASAVGKMPAAR